MSVNVFDSAFQLMRQQNELSTGLGSAPITGNDMYDRLYQANPYRNLTYKQSFWQRIASMLGFRTDADRWLEDAQVNSNEYDAQVASIMQQNAYNDPTAMAQRERSAGMNPDLLGIGDVAESASPQEDVNGMSPNVGDEFTSFGESLASVISRSVAMYKDFKSIAELDNIIESQDFDNAQKMIVSVDGYLNSRFQEGDFNNRSSFDRKIGSLKSELESELLGDYEGSSAYRLGIDKKRWKRWTEQAGQQLDSLLTDTSAWKRYAEAGGARAEGTAAKLNPLYSKTDEFDDTMMGLVPILSDNYRQLLVDKSKNDAYQEALRTGALENEGMKQDLEGTELAFKQDNDFAIKKASADIAKYDNEWYQHSLNQTIANMQKQMLDVLQQKAKTSRFARLMLMNWTMNNMVNIGVNASANASVGLNFGLGANIARTASTILKP